MDINSISHCLMGAIISTPKLVSGTWLIAYSRENLNVGGDKASLQNRSQSKN